MMINKGVVFQVKFIDNPKGLRFNSAMSRHISTQGIQYIRVELGRFGLTLIPALQDDANTKVHKVLFSGEVAQIASADLYNVFSKRGLTNEKVVGEWRGNKYAFDLTPKLLGSEYRNFVAGAGRTMPNIATAPKIRLPLIPGLEPVRMHTSKPEIRENGRTVEDQYVTDDSRAKAV
jgi:hypothetical protein